MKKLLPLIMLATPLMAGCVSANSAEGAKAEAYAKCRYAPGPEEREKCMKTELALIQARERNEAQRIQTNREDAEQRQAILEASGVSREDAKQTIESGLHLPD
ncbi:MAG: hypothetical protein KDA56_13755 [Hyphomonas sp.]|nr:hypothetical protein [Hyphomonas sp.]